MTQEIIYTSAPAGLKSGSHGFCTVVSTSGMARNLAMKLESMSAYRHAFPPHTSASKFNPVNYSHLKIQVGGRAFHVLSRIADAGQDYTQRSNKLAHHVALDQSEIVPAGPAAILATAGFSCTQWDGKVQLIPPRKVPEAADLPAGPCRAWEQISGDAGWAGMVASHLLSNAEKPISVIFPKGTDTLLLINEVFSLLPEDKRWRTTFSTYFTKLPAGLDCQLRFVLDDTSEATALRRHPHAIVIDLAKPAIVPENNPWISLARTGQVERLRPIVPPQHRTTSPPPVSAHSQPSREPMDLELSDKDLVAETRAPLQKPDAGGTYRFQKPQLAPDGQQSSHIDQWQARHHSQSSNGKRQPKRIIYVLLWGSGLILLLLLAFLIGSRFGKQQSVMVAEEASLASLSTETEQNTETPVQEQKPTVTLTETQDSSTPQKLEDPEKKLNPETRMVADNSLKTITPSPEPAKPKPKPKQKHNPFQDTAFHNRVLALPKREQKRPGVKEKWFPLAKLDLLPEQSLKLDIIGGKTLLQDSNSDFEVVPHSGSKEPHHHWVIQYPPSPFQNRPTTIAEMKLDEGALSFKWNSKYTHDDLLRYVSLKLLVDDQLITCQLKKTVETDPLVFGETINQHLIKKVFKIDLLDSFKKNGYKVFLEITACHNQVNKQIECQFMSAPPHIVEKKYKLIFPMEFQLNTEDKSLKSPPQFKVEFSLEDKNKNEEYTLICKLYGAPRYLKNVQNLEDAQIERYEFISTHEGELWTSDYKDEVMNELLGHTNEETIKNSLKDSRKLLDEELKKIKEDKSEDKKIRQEKYDKDDKDLRLVTSMLETYPKQRKFFKETFGPQSTGCRIHYRLFLKMEEHEIDLYRSREN